ncbi:MAG: hypothetical protein IJV31_06825 [Clostridia bacterium]|nr:hypothetical protein [Clostridia bacterium]
MEKRIIVDNGIKKQIAKALSCTVQMVSLALLYRRNTILAKKIRYVALKEYGGVKIGE